MALTGQGCSALALLLLGARQSLVRGGQDYASGRRMLAAPLPLPSGCQCLPPAPPQS